MDNRTNGVLIKVDGEEETVFKFRDQILESSPAASQVKSVEIIKKKVIGFKNFRIVQSKNDENQITEISPDIAVCPACLNDLQSDIKRINYPFVNCTNCGPRFTIIEGLPYDRDKTSMKEFKMCSNCASEYHDVVDRRFHAQPIACSKCGPVYTYTDYLSSTHAGKLEKELHIPLIRVQHHHAHIASCMAENHIDEKVIGISMDGTGYGNDGYTWGSEFLVADLKGFTRYTYFDYVPMPGGDMAVDEPWRMALSYLYKYLGDSIDYTVLPAFRTVPSSQIRLVREMIDKGINTPLTSGAGRLFDAVSALLRLCPVSGFDSEAPMRLESVINSTTESYYPFDIGGTVVFAETLKAVINDMRSHDVSFISTKFHNTVALAITEVSEKIRKETSINKVVLSGGVFQNKYLLEKLIRMLTGKNFYIYTNHLVPANDGGVSMGQLIVASKIKGLCV